MLNVGISGHFQDGSIRKCKVYYLFNYLLQYGIKRKVGDFDLFIFFFFFLVMVLSHDTVFVTDNEPFTRYIVGI